ncbi:MAG TPA: hypothetical protein VN048_01300 [Verrucomicrobiae bacterium]|jgi:hypothetical protein|nr:hypothetical protein [Verrucomicrobiae bacterium]
MKKTLLFLGLLMPVLVSAQQYSIDWYKVSGGGGTSSNSQYVVSGSIGQHDAGGPMTNGNYSLTGGFWSLYAVQTPGAPMLFITKSGNNAILSWSANATGFLLENNGSVTAPGGWTTVSPAPSPVNGTNYVTNTIVPGNNYYLLRHP